MRCDAHVHIVGPVYRYPQVPTRMFLAAEAKLEVLRRGAAPHGISRFVIVQPSFYGTDNTLLLETLDVLGDHGRGVVVVDASAPPESLGDYARRGVRGLRLNLYSPTQERESEPLDKAFAAATKLAQAFDWHVEVIASLPVLLDCADVLARSAVPVVVDHYGLYGRSLPDSREGRALLDLVGLPHVWMKLSAPYRVSDDRLETRPDSAWLEAMLARAADRCVWGSDWPHVPPHETQTGAMLPVPYRDIPYERLVDDFLRELGSTALADLLMQDNPARLYGFPAR
jgi:predicted TIM-barrel fold metal-dependent hydrolase